MIKTIPPYDARDSRMEVIKVASTGFRGHDLSAFIKRASHPLAQWVRQHTPPPGEVWTHLLAMGSTETVGPNRNHDGYTASMLQRDHPTFEKLARLYRNHKNTDPAKSYGVIKKAHYNPEMQRVELIAAWNATKEAADRNGGLIADRTIDRLESGQDVAVSMACKIPYDVCIACGNKAPNRAVYCGPQQCTKYGGCRDNLGKVFDDGTYLYVDNPKCDFYDLSDVSDTRGADRTAFITGKVAAFATERMGGAEIAEKLGLIVPDYLLGKQQLSALTALRKLASIDPSRIPQGPSNWGDILDSRGASLPQFSMDKAATTQRQEWIAQAANVGLLLPPAWWLSINSGQSIEKCASFFGDIRVSPQELLDRADCVDLLATYAIPVYEQVSTKLAMYVPTARSEERLAWKVAAALTAPKAAPQSDIPLNVRKEAATRYLAYQANVLSLHENNSKFPLLLTEAIRHNREHPW